MAVIGLVFSLFGLGAVCWLLFLLAVYALPFCIGMTMAVAALHNGAGIAGAFAVGALAGGVALALGRIAFATVRPPLLRILIALLYAVPAAIAGYQLSLGLAKIGMTDGGWARSFRPDWCCPHRHDGLLAHGAVCPATDRAKTWVHRLTRPWTRSSAAR